MEASRRWGAVLLQQLLLALCARAAGNVIHVGDGLYSGGTSVFDINASACPSHSAACDCLLPSHAHGERKRPAPHGISVNWCCSSWRGHERREFVR